MFFPTRQFVVLILVARRQHEFQKFSASVPHLWRCTYLHLYVYASPASTPSRGLKTSLHIDSYFVDNFGLRLSDFRACLKDRPFFCSKTSPVAAPHVPHQGLPLYYLLLLWNQVPQRKIIHNILHILNPVLQAIALPPQDVILQIQNLEARKHILNELVDEERALIVTERDGIARKTSLTRKLIKQSELGSTR